MKSKTLKQVILAIIIIFSFYGTSSGAIFNWKKVAVTSDDSSEWYYDKNSVVKVGEFRYYWILTNYLRDIEDNIFSVIGNHIVNCNTYESRWITYTGFNRLMGRGKVVDDYVIPEIGVEFFDWKYFHPENTTYGTLLKHVCKEKVNN